MLFRAYLSKPEGEALFQKFFVRNTPTILIATSDGREIDRHKGYGGYPPEQFKENIENAYKNENNFLNLTRAYEKDSTDLVVIAKLAERWRSYYIYEKMAEFAEKILKQPEKAKQLKLPVGRDEVETSIYEFAKYTTTFSDPEAVLHFATEFPNSALLNSVFRDYRSFLFNKDNQEKALTVFDELIKQFPENSALINSYLRYCTRSKSNYDRGIELADQLYKAKAGKIDIEIASLYADLLIEQDDMKKVQEIPRQLIKDNPDKEIDIEMEFGFLYQQKKKYEEAFASFENIIKNYPDYYPAYYQVGRTAVFSGTNLDRGLQCFKEYLQHEPDEDQPTWANAHYRMGMIYEHKGDKDSAQKEYETALKLDPAYEDAQKALEKLYK